MKKINYTGINHLAFATNNLDKTIRFWRDFLGMKMILGFGHNGYKHYFFKLSEVDRISFFEWPDVKTPDPKDHGVPVKDKLIFDHISIGVKSDDDLWNLKDKFEAADIWVSEVIDHGFIHSIYSFDPNEIPLEFSAPVKGVDLDKNPIFKDSDITEIAKEGKNPQFNKWPQVKEETKDKDRMIFEGEGLDIIFPKD